jgi:amino acid transporter
VASTLHVTVSPWILFLVVLAASSPNQRLADITDAMIYAITAFAGFEAAAALGEEARNSRRSVPGSIVGIGPAGTGRRRCCGRSTS